jgi:hypothetical protein
MVEVTIADNLLHQPPGESSLLDQGTPFCLQSPIGWTQIVGRNAHGNVVGHMDIDVVAEQLYPTGIVTM